MRFMPAARTCCSMAVCAPVPSAIIVSTAPTPMVMPSIVSTVCRRCRRSAFTAIASVDRIDIRLILADQRQELARGRRLRRVRTVVHNFAVLEPDDPRAVLGDLLLVRDEDDRDPALLF